MVDQIYNLIFNMKGTGAPGLATNLNTVSTAQGKVETTTGKANTQLGAQTTNMDKVKSKTPPAVTQTGKFANNMGAIGTKAGGAAKGIASVLNSLSGVTGIDTSQIESALLLFATMPKGLSAVSKGIGGIGIAIGKQLKIISTDAPGAKTAIDGLAGSSRGLMGALGPILIIVAAVAVVLVLVKTNAFGFRDALNGIGVAIGNAVPQLRPFLELIKSVVSALLGITGEGALSPAAAIQAFTDSITQGIASIQTAFNNFVLDPVGFVTNILTSIGKWFTDNPARIAGAILGPIGLAIILVDEYLGGSISQMITNFFAAAQKFAIETLPNWFKAVFSTQNLVNGINGVVTSIKAALVAFFNVFGALSELKARAIFFMTNFLAGIVSFISANASKILSTFAGFWKLITDTATNTGKAIPKLILEGIKSAVSKLKEAGSAIWNAIKSGIKALVPDNLEFLIPGLANGGIITGAKGLIYTTNGPTAMIVGDNRSGKEDIMAVPRDNPRGVMAAANRRYGTGGGDVMLSSGGRATINIRLPVYIGGKIVSELIKTVEIELGKNMRSIA